MPDETHIASFVVQADASRLKEITEKLNALEGINVHADNAAGKLVVTAETDSEARIVAVLDEISQIRGVFSANLVYHHSEETAALDQELMR